MSSKHNTRSKGRSGPHREPLSSDLPGLYPVHDGSYGVNTLINEDPVRRRRRRSGPLDENDEDSRFMKRMGDYGNLTAAGEEAVSATEARDETLSGAGGGAGVLRGGKKGRSKGSQPNNGGSGPKDIYADPALHIKPHVPTQASFLPIGGNNEVRPPFKDIGYRSTDPHTLVHNRLQPAPPPSRSSFYGVPTGFGSAFRAPATPYRPVTLRGYTDESAVFNNAQLRTPPESGINLGYTTGAAADGAKPMTQEEQRIVENLIHDMRRPERPSGPEIGDITAESLEHLSVPEIDAARDLIQDMAFDPETALKLMDALDEARRNASLSVPGRGPEQAVQQPAAQEPAIQEPVVQELDVQEPGIQQPHIQQSGFQQSGSHQPSFHQPGVQEHVLQDQVPQKTPGSGPDTVTDDEWARINYLINDMRSTQPTAEPELDIEPLDGLSTDEINAVYDLVQDMGKNITTTLKILDELKRVSRERSAQQQTTEEPQAEEPLVEAPQVEEPQIEEPYIEESSPGAQGVETQFDDGQNLGGQDIAEQYAEQQGGQDQEGQKTPTLDGLTDEEWSKISWLINDMQTGLRPATPATPNIPIEPLGSLHPEEIEAIYGLVQDMGKDIPTTLRILDELNGVAKQQAANEQAANEQAANEQIANEQATNQQATKQPVANKPTPPAEESQPDDMTYDDWRKIDYLVRDMRKQPRPALSDDIVIEDLSDLSRAEIRAVRGLVRDMGKNRATVRRVMNELDRVSRNKPAEEPSATRLFADRGDSPAADPDSLSVGGSKLPPIIYPDQAGMPQRQKQRRQDAPRRRRDSSWYQNLDPVSGVFSSVIFFLFILTTVWLVLSFLSDMSLPPLNVGSSQLSDWYHGKWGFNKEWSFSGALKAGIGHSLPVWGSEDSTSPTHPDIISEVIESITAKIPEKVFVDVEKGKQKISQDFYHALSGENRDDVVTSLANAIKEGRDIPLDVITSRLGPAISSGLPITLDAHPPEVSSHGWSNWLKRNKDSVEKAIGGEVLSRENFMKLFNQELQSYKQEIRRELDAQGTRTQELMGVVEAVRNAAAKTRGLTEQQVRNICEAIVRRGIENIKLDAVANGQIRGYANGLFANQINFFGVGSGVVVDPKYQSTAWQPPKDYYKFRSKRWYQRDGYQIQPPLAAVSPWTEEGECFCAGQVHRGQTDSVNSMHLLLSREIIPQHLVAEHILPGSTLDPEAMPREIEMWAYIEEVNLREELRAFSSMHFTGAQAPAELPNRRPLDEGFVKIGHFTYENRTEGDGIQIFKIDDQLIQMGAVTEQVVVRAISNYGSDHTCFYRLRLYGDIQEGKAPWKNWEHDVVRDEVREKVRAGKRKEEPIA
ncbi:hypothetical protein F5Y04DRAFT_131077 [Hypomontagnella monticulosa]|nr:hypothetical protein F5Y04DRAFT_131077 [Hypomontagnella monticulosa]